MNLKTQRSDNNENKTHDNDVESTFVIPIHFEGDISFETLYKETYKLVFDHDNNHLKLNTVKNNNMCNIPHCDKPTKNKDILICYTHRKHIANQLYTLAFDRAFISNEVILTVTNLMMDDNYLIKKSQEFEQIPNYFINIYSYLIWQLRMVKDLMSNLSFNEINENNTNSKTIIFDFLFLTHAYLREVSQLLILFYSCFNWNFISVFYPWIAQSIGNIDCPTIFCKIKTNASSNSDSANNSNKNNKKKVDSKNNNNNNDNINSQSGSISNEDTNLSCFYSPGVLAFKLAIDEIDIKLVATIENDIERAMNGILSLRQLIDDIFNANASDDTSRVQTLLAGKNSETNNNNTSNSSSTYTNPISHALSIESKLNKMIRKLEADNQLDALDTYEDANELLFDKMGKLYNKVNVAKLNLSDLTMDDLAAKFKTLYDNNTNTSIVGFLKKLVNNKTDNNDVSYNYYNLDQLKQAIKQTQFITKYNIIDDLIRIICQYHGIITWSKTDKSSEVSIFNSNDNKISYIVYTQMNHMGYLTQNISLIIQYYLRIG